eukprot:s1858_g4.t1
MVAIALVTFLFQIASGARDADVTFEQNCIGLAAAESLMEQLHNENGAMGQQFDEMQGSINRLQRAHNELESQDEMLSGMVDGIQYGIVMLAGYINHSNLTPAQRQRMFRVEQANLVAARTMGSNRYMATVRETFRNESNSCLSREDWDTAADFQRCIMLVLDSLDSAQPLERGARIRQFQMRGDRVERLPDRQRQRGEGLIAERLQADANQPEIWLGAADEDFGKDTRYSRKSWRGHRATLEPETWFWLDPRLTVRAIATLHDGWIGVWKSGLAGSLEIRNGLIS